MDSNILTLLRIARVELNPKAKQAICSNLTCAEEFFNLLDSDLKEFQFTQKEIEDFNFYKTADLTQDIQKVESLGVNLISYWDENYPKRLADIFDPPIVLHVRGTLPSDNNIFVGVVGSRNCNTYGKTACELITGDLSRYGIVIVSGGAYGIDTIAHKTALSNMGKTVVVLGCGIDIPYPATNANLFEEIISRDGAVISEAPFGCPPTPYRFPIRNRIVSGLCEGVLVCQASVASGSLITANSALEQNRQVYSIPGNITDKQCSGCLKLIKEGAVVVTEAQDIFTDLNLPLSKDDNSFNLMLDEKEINIYDILSFEPTNLDTIMEKTKYDLKTVTSTLMMMEINGYIKSVPINSYIRTK